MYARTRIAASTLTAALLAAGLALAGPAAAADGDPQTPALVAVPSPDEVLYEGPVNDLLMPVGDVLELVDPTGVEERQGEDETLTAPAGEDNVTEIPTERPKPAKKRPGRR